jgi:restriction system protein
MPVPNFQSLFRPILAFAQDGSEKSIRDAIAAVAKQLLLTEDDLNQLQPSGRDTVFENRAHWARTYLEKAGAIKKTRRSHFKITERGKKLLADNPISITERYYDSFQNSLRFKGHPSNPKMNKFKKHMATLLMMLTCHQ